MSQIYLLTILLLAPELHPLIHHLLKHKTTFIIISDKRQKYWSSDWNSYVSLRAEYNICSYRILTIITVSLPIHHDGVLPVGTAAAALLRKQAAVMPVGLFLTEMLLSCLCRYPTMAAGIHALPKPISPMLPSAWCVGRLTLPSGIFIRNTFFP